ncbi:MAG: PD40 domain-containing protein [Calditrichaeota bacterium]|nr:PD40 domain-containing protein [Calditrichota bacterium]
MLKTIYSILILTIMISCGGGGASTTLTDPAAQTDPVLARLINQAKTTNSPNAYVELARYYAKQKQITNAIKNYEQATKLDSNRVDIFFELGEYTFNNNVKRTALRAFKFILEGNKATSYTDRIASYIFGYRINQITFGDHNSAYPSFSPDSKEIYFQTDQNGNWDIAKVPVEGGSPSIVLQTDANEEHPTISYNRRFMIYTTDEYDTRLVHNSQKWREIQSYEFGTAKKTRLTLNYLDDFYPRVKNRSELTFVREIPTEGINTYGSRKTNVYVMNYDGSFQVPLTKGSYHDNSGAVTFDSGETYFSSDRGGKFWNIYAENNQSKDVRQITDFDFNCISVDVDSAGNRIVFTGDQNSTLDIYMTNQTGNRLERITFHQGDADQAVFSPDGQYLAFHSNNGGSYDIYLVYLNIRSEEPTISNLLRKIDSDLLTL